MGLKKPGGYPTTATERMDAARSARQRAVTQGLLLVAILARIWPDSHRCRLDTGELAVCLHTPAGPLVWRLLDDEEPVLFAHLPLAAEHSGDPRGRHKEAILLSLATEGWK